MTTPLDESTLPRVHPLQRRWLMRTGARRGAHSLSGPATPDDRQRSLFDHDSDGVNPTMLERSSSPNPVTMDVQPRALQALSPTTATAPVGQPPTALPEAFVHPHATHHVELQGVLVGYVFTRARRRSIGLLVGSEGLSVRAPRWVTMAEVREAVNERAAWVLKHLRALRTKDLSAERARIHWHDGVTIRYLGEPLLVLLDDRVSGALIDEAVSTPTADAAHAVLRLGLRRDAMPHAIRDAVHAWLQGEAQSLFAKRCDHFAASLGVRVTKLSLSAARTRWGSAGADGSVRLNWRLIHYPMDCIDYVVAHELAHLRHMNHGPAFWRVVSSVVPEYQAAQNVLKQESHALLD